MAANAALAANRTAKTIGEEVAAILAEAEAADAAEDAMHGELRRVELPAELRRREDRRCVSWRPSSGWPVKPPSGLRPSRRRSRPAPNEEATTGKRRRGRKPTPRSAEVDPQAKANPTDPDIGIMKTTKRWVQGYNAQAIVSEDQIIIAGAVTLDANDVQRAGAMVTAAFVNLEMVSGEEAALAALCWPTPDSGRRPTPQSETARLLQLRGRTLGL